MLKRGLIALGFAVSALVTGCSASDDRQWMKINERYTTAEFQRDFVDCSKTGKLDEDCMRARGWVAVTPKAEKSLDMSDPRNYSPRSGIQKY